MRAVVFQITDRQRTTHVIDKIAIVIAEDLRTYQPVRQSIVLRCQRSGHQFRRSRFTRRRGIERKHRLRFERRTENVFGPGRFENWFLQFVDAQN